MHPKSILVVLFALFAVHAFGQAYEPGLLPDLAAANPWQASFQVSGRDSLKIVFHSAEWPNVSWTALRPERIVLSVGVDDTPYPEMVRAARHVFANFYSKQY